MTKAVVITDRYPEYELGDRKIDPAGLQVDQTRLLNAYGPTKDGAIYWLRTGGCTAGCGACCEAMVIPITGTARMAEHGQSVEIDIAPHVLERPGFEDWEYWLGLHDVAIFNDHGRLWVEVPATHAGDEEDIRLLDAIGITLVKKQSVLLAHIARKCNELTDDYRCGLFGDPRRPQLCSIYPQHPYDIEGLEKVCTYKFQAVTDVQELERRARPATPARSKSKKRKKGGKRR